MTEKKQKNKRPTWFEHSVHERENGRYSASCFRASKLSTAILEISLVLKLLCDDQCSNFSSRFIKFYTDFIIRILYFQLPIQKKIDDLKQDYDHHSGKIIYYNFN